MTSSQKIDRLPANESFATTQWSLVIGGGDRNSPLAGTALQTLCQRYWYPLYAFVRMRRYNAIEAQDLTQEFFARLLEKNVLADASPRRGRFRSFLLTAMKHFLSDQWDKAKAQKRGGSRPVLSLDVETAESRFSLEPSHDLTPDKLFERQWACTLLQLAIERLEIDLSATGKTREFELFKAALTGDGRGVDYAHAALELGISEDAARQIAHRLKRRYRELLREELAQTLADPGDVDDEIRRLFQTFGS